MATIAVGDQDVNETDGLVKDPNDLKLELVEPSKAKDRSMPAYKVPTAKEFLTLLIPASMGLVFGFSILKGGVFDPKAIRGQFTFESFVLLKMFVGALAASCLSLAVLSKCSPEKFKKVRMGHITTAHSYIVSGLGGFLVGVGMLVSGACPGMVLAQVGGGVPNSWFTFLGCILGAALYGLLQPHLPFDGHTKYFRRGADTSSDTLEKKIPFLSKIGFTSIALCLGLMFAGFVVFLEVMFPWTSSDERPVAFSLQPSTNNPFTTPAGWPPGLAGACIGFLQIPGVLLLNKAIGSSSAYVTAVAQCFPDGTCEKGRLDLIKSKRAGYWQLAYIIGAVLGGYLGALPVEQTTLGSSVVVNILGGMLVLFGSRLGQGCTSGHGISGFSLLGTHSIVATCTMFGGGIVVGYILDAAGVEFAYKG